jgi:antitoxin component YwqK of YwqJK toxin-antitoxin module
LPDGTLEVGIEHDLVRNGQWKTHDPRGILRAELLLENRRRTGPCRYYDAEGRLCAEGSWSGSGRRGLWTVDEIVGDGPRWISFFE